MKLIKTLSLLMTVLACGGVMLTACNKNNSSLGSSSSTESSIDSSTDSTDSSTDSSSGSADDSEDSSSGDDAGDTEEIPGYIPPPAEEENPMYKTPSSGNGGEISRFECEEGYYQFEITARAMRYYSFSVKGPGQYALYTVEPTDTVVLKRFSASAEFLNPTSAEPALDLKDGKLYSLVNCSEREYDYQEDVQTSYWRATFGLQSTSGTQTVAVRFVRVADPVVEAKLTTEKVYPTEIKGVAQDVPHHSPMVVPYNSDYFYDPDYELTFNTPIGGEKTGTVTAKGFYRRCERDEQGNIIKEGEVIYAGIERSTRLMADKFSEVYGSAFFVYHKTDEATNTIYLHDYTEFIPNDSGDNSAIKDPAKACYVNVCNADGLFPVNKELYDFFVEYVKANPPILEDGESVTDENKWLSACYYYIEATEGSKNFPIEIPVSGFTKENTSITYTVNVDRKYSPIYHTIKWHELVNMSGGFTTGYYTVSSNDDNAWLTIGTKNYSGKFSVTFEVDSETGKTLAFSYGTTPQTAGQTGTFDVTFTKTEGVHSTPYTLSSLGEVSLQTREIINADGDMVYFATYQYSATGLDAGANLTLSLTVETAGVTFETLEGVAENNVVTVDDEGNLTFTFLVSSLAPIADIPATVTLTPITSA